MKDIKATDFKSLNAPLFITHGGKKGKVVDLTYS